MSKVTENLRFEDANIFFRNFQGKESQYNQEGNRNFCVEVMPLDFARQLKADGWNVRFRDPRNEGDEPTAYMQVAVSYKNIPPTIHLISSAGNTILDEDAIGMLDWADIANVDFVVRPYNWEVNGNKGVKAYLKSMYVTIEEDPFEKKYAASNDDIPF